MSNMAIPEVPEFLREKFSEYGGIDVIGVETRAYPDETNYIVYVEDRDISEAAAIGNRLDDEIVDFGERAFVVVRKATAEQIASANKGAPLRNGVQDPRATELIHLISARAKVSEVQPSLAYIRDAQENLSQATEGKNHLVFGRRGAGKSALLVEAKRIVSASGSMTCWINMHTLRGEPAERVFLYYLESVLSEIISEQKVNAQSKLHLLLSSLYQEVMSLISQTSNDETEVIRLIPRVQRILKRYLDIYPNSFFVFIDDFYYLPRTEQPRVLDMMNRAIQDTQIWLKIASVRHLTRWFQTNPPLGLQTIHDTGHIDLDLTLQETRRAKNFLEKILQEFAKRVDIPAIGRLFHAKAIDRLVLASGAVPRDFLILASAAISKARVRSNAKLVGVQDVNQAAGDARQAKIQELEEDMATDAKRAKRTLDALGIVRNFCVNEKEFTYFLVDFREKESDPRYGILTELLDVRLIHLIDASVSDSHEAGRRYEAFMLDLSQFSGARLKQGIRVLDLQGGVLVSHRTRTKEKGRLGRTPLEVISILRNAPTLRLANLPEEEV